MMKPEYKQEILDSIKNGENLFGHVNFGIFYSAGEGLVAKIFSPHSSKEESQKEFENLKRFKNLEDPRIIVPEAYERLYLGTSGEITKLGLKEFPYIFFKEEPLYAVVMELLKGKTWEYAEDDERKKYANSLVELIDALVEYKIGIFDLKSSEIICLENTDKVGLVDLHLAEWNCKYQQETSWSGQQMKDSWKNYYGSIYKKAKKFRNKKW